MKSSLRDMKDLSSEELEVKTTDMKKEIFNLRFQ